MGTHYYLLYMEWTLPVGHNLNLYISLMALASPLFASNVTRGVDRIKPFSSMLIGNKKLSTRKLFPCLAVIATQTAQVIILSSPPFFKFLLLHFSILKIDIVWVPDSAV